MAVFGLRPFAAAMAAATALVLASCSASARQDEASTSAEADAGATAIAALPNPSYVVNGRTVVVRLPYRTRDGHLWIDADPSASSGSLMFSSLDIEPRGGPDGTDLAVFTYTADRPGVATLKFALTPAGRTIAPDLAGRSGVASRYEPTITVN